MSDFIQKCLIGDALLEEIDDYIDDWHQGESAMSLHEFLGMTRNEYYLWAEDASSLPHIVNARIRGIELTESAERQGALSIAARSDRLSEISDRLIGWLKDEGLWE